MMEKRKKKSNTNKYFNFGLKIRPSYDYLNELQQIKKLFFELSQTDTYQCIV